MLIHLSMMLSAASGWGIPSDGEAPLVNKSEITDQVDGARDGHRHLGISCDASWSVTPIHPFATSPDVAILCPSAATGPLAATAAVTTAVTAAATAGCLRAAIAIAIRNAIAPRATTPTAATAAVMAGDDEYTLNAFLPYPTRVGDG